MSNLNSFLKVYLKYQDDKFNYHIFHKLQNFQLQSLIKLFSKLPTLSLKTDSFFASFKMPASVSLKGLVGGPKHISAQKALMNTHCVSDGVETYEM